MAHLFYWGGGANIFKHIQETIIVPFLSALWLRDEPEA